MTSLENTLACALENLEGADPIQLTCEPLNRLYTERDVSVTAQRLQDRIVVAVGTEGSADAVYDGNDVDAGASAVYAAIASIVPDLSHYNG